MLYEAPEVPGQEKETVQRVIQVLQEKMFLWRLKTELFLKQEVCDRGEEGEDLVVGVQLQYLPGLQLTRLLHLLGGGPGDLLLHNPPNRASISNTT